MKRFIKILLPIALLFFHIDILYAQNDITLKKIESMDLTLTFKGYVEINDEYTFKILPSIPDTINTQPSIQFLKIGDKIFGYEIVFFIKKIIDEKDKNGRTIKKDVSVLYLKNEKGKEIKLQLNEKKHIKDKCFVAILKNSDNYLWEGKSVWIGHKKYRVKKISKNKVILNDGIKDIVLNKDSLLDSTGYSNIRFEFKIKKKPVK